MLMAQQSIIRIQFDLKGDGTVGTLRTIKRSLYDANVLVLGWLVQNVKFSGLCFFQKPFVFLKNFENGFL